MKNNELTREVEKKIKIIMKFHRENLQSKMILIIII